MTRFLFWIERPLHIPMLEPLWEHILAQKLGESAFATFAEPKEGLGLDRITLRALEVKGLFHAQDPTVFRPDITFVADHNYQYVEGLGRIVNVGHGTISKGLYFLPGGLSRRESLADLLCVPGTAHKALLQKATRQPIAVCGMPKLDKCFLEKTKRFELLQHWGLDPSRKTLLFAPTFNEELSLLPHLQKPLCEYLPPGWNLIAKLHGATPKKIADRFLENAKNNPSILIASAEDVSVFFPVADLLLSDLSSVIFEFSILDKPILLFDSPWQKRYVHYNRKHLEYRYRGIGLRFSDLEKLPDLISEASSRHDSFLPVQQKLSRQIVSVRDGSSAQRVLEASRKVLAQAPDLTVLRGNWKGLEREISVLKTPFLVFCSEDWILSSHGVRALVNHLKKEPRADWVSPMIVDSSTFTASSLRHFGIQLGYELPGESLPVKNRSELCFAVRTKFLQEALRFRKKKMKSLLALDVLLFQKSSGVGQIRPWERLPPAQHSIFSGFVSHAWKGTPRNFLSRVFRKIHQNRKPWTPDREIQFLSDLGSAFGKIGDWKEALFHLGKASRLKQGVQKNSLARLFFHLGYCHHKMKNSKKALACFKRCLELEPGHRKAREFLNA